MNKSTAKVNIYGSDYVIKGDAQADHIEEVARFVDAKMREINRTGTIKSPLKVAILAALNIADEFLKTREDQSNTVQSMELRARRLIEKLDEFVPEDETELPVEHTNSPAISLFSQE